MLLVLMESLVHQKKSLVLISVKQTKFCLSLHCNADNSYFFVSGKEIFKFEAYNKNFNFPIKFCLRSILVLLSLNGNVFGFLVDFNSIDKCDILND